MEFHVVHVTSGMLSCIKIKEKVYISAGPEVGANLYSKNPIIENLFMG
jgi:hypothetical protein